MGMYTELKVNAEFKKTPISIIKCIEAMVSGIHDVHEYTA